MVPSFCLGSQDQFSLLSVQSPSMCHLGGRLLKPTARGSLIVLLHPGIELVDLVNFDVNGFEEGCAGGVVAMGLNP